MSQFHSRLLPARHRFQLHKVWLQPLHIAIQGSGLNQRGASHDGNEPKRNRERIVIAWLLIAVLVILGFLCISDSSDEIGHAMRR
jgi:hypothetical protein